MATDWDWHAEYVKATAMEEDGEDSMPASTMHQTPKTPVDKVLTFLDRLLTQEGGEWWTKLCLRAKCAAKKCDGQESTKSSAEDKKQLKTLKKRLAVVGGELLIKLPELNASANSKDTLRSTKVRVLQLQLVCRLLCYGALTRKEKEEKKLLKKEIRGLLGRVALLLDAANPPSLADEGAVEHSPFQEFLLQKLAPRLQFLLPELVQYLLRVCELEEKEDTKDEQDNDATNALLTILLPVVKPPQPLVDLPKSIVIGKGSILSALRQERPTKRARPDASALFKEVQLPHQLQQKQTQPRPLKSRRVSKGRGSNTSKNAYKSDGADHSITSRSSQALLLGAAAGTKSLHKPRARDCAGAATTGVLSNYGETDLLRRAAMNSSMRGSVPHFLHRAISERCVGQQSTVSSSPGVSAQGRGAIPTGKTQSPPLRRALTTSSVIMRTPDRPKRMAARTTRRVLVEASPPLRRPNGAGAAPRLLQPKQSRPGANPPPLFR